MLTRLLRAMRRRERDTLRHMRYDALAAAVADMFATTHERVTLLRVHMALCHTLRVTIRYAVIRYSGRGEQRRAERGAPLCLLPHC